MTGAANGGAGPLLAEVVPEVAELLAETAQVPVWVGWGPRSEYRRLSLAAPPQELDGEGEPATFAECVAEAWRTGVPFVSGGIIVVNGRVLGVSRRKLAEAPEGPRRALLARGVGMLLRSARDVFRRLLAVHRGDRAPNRPGFYRDEHGRVVSFAPNAIMVFDRDALPLIDALAGFHRTAPRAWVSLGELRAWARANAARYPAVVVEAVAVDTAALVAQLALPGPVGHLPDEVDVGLGMTLRGQSPVLVVSGAGWWLELAALLLGEADEQRLPVMTLASRRTS